MKKFETPAMEVEKLNVMDVIATSNVCAEDFTLEEEPA